MTEVAEAGRTIERVKEFWNRRPCNIRHSVKPVNTREYFDEVEARRYFVEPHISQFAQFEHWQGKRVLEVGCGIGTDSINFARNGADLTVVDLSDQSLEICRKRFAIYGLNARFYCGNVEELSAFVPVESYDLVYSFGVVHHTPRPDRVLAEIKKYCSPQTEVRLMLYSKWSWKVLWIIMTYGKGAFWRADELVRTYSEAQAGCPVTYYYSYHDVQNLMEGYRLTELRKAHIFPYKISKYIKYEYEWVWYFRWMPRRMFHWLEKNFGWHTLIVAKPKEE